ncbi:MAG: hypothetical protein R6U52_09270 [Kosmotogaceae bacterium]
MKIIILCIFLIMAASTIAQEQIILPVFSMPVFDQENGIIEVFYERENDSKLSITVVFKDEDHPCCLVDTLYDAYRFFKYGRVEDIETFYLLLEKNGSVSGVEFPGVFSGNHKFEDTKDLHGSASFTSDEITFIDERPVIYVNTWNHMFGVEPSFYTKQEIIIYKYPLSKGKRENAENKYSWLY